MNKPKHVKSKPKVIGEKYDRNRYEVHARLWDDDKNDWLSWYCQTRNPTSQGGAEQSIEDHKAQNRNIAPLIGLGRWEYRIVKVTAQCEVVA